MWKRSSLKLDQLLGAEGYVRRINISYPPGFIFSCRKAYYYYYLSCQGGGSSSGQCKETEETADIFFPPVDPSNSPPAAWLAQNNPLSIIKAGGGGRGLFDSKISKSELPPCKFSFFENLDNENCGREYGGTNLSIICSTDSTTLSSMYPGMHAETDKCISRGCLVAAQQEGGKFVT